MKQVPLILAGEPWQENFDLEVVDKYSGEGIAQVALAGPKQIEAAIAAAADSAEAMRALPPYTRQNILNYCVERFRERSEELAKLLCQEVGKPIRDARGEVMRLIDTFRIAAEEAVRIGGEVQELAISARAQGYFGMWKWVPLGPCSLISPFNFPLNLVAHKVAPAIAAGCPFVLKPASATPLGALVIGEILRESEMPRSAFSILPCRREGAEQFTIDERLKLLSFTGSPDVGWELKKRAGKKKVLLELGGNAAVIVDAGTEVNEAVERIVTGAFYQSGQSCISVQRILVHASIYADFRDRLVAATQKLVMGDPLREEVAIGPIVSEKQAERIEQWIQSALSQGAKLLCGGQREGQMVEPTLLENVPVSEKVSCEEVFGPVALLDSFSDFEEALARVNSSRYGLQAGIFTRDIQRAHRAWDVLEVGAVLINEVPSWRVDHMPYGGVKDSGLGREGVRFAMEEMSERRLFVLRRTS